MFDQVIQAIVCIRSCVVGNLGTITYMLPNYIYQKQPNFDIQKNGLWPRLDPHPVAEMALRDVLEMKNQASYDMESVEVQAGANKSRGPVASCSTKK